MNGQPMNLLLRIAIVVALAGIVDAALSGQVRRISTLSIPILRTQLEGGQAKPTYTSGGGSTGTNLVHDASTDRSGRVTLGTGTITPLVLTFGAEHASPPACFGNNESSTNNVSVVATTTTLQFTGTFAAGNVLTWGCP